MPNFRRYHVPEAIVFITGVTRHRKPYLRSQHDLDLFWDTLRRVQDIHHLAREVDVVQLKVM